MSADMNVWTGIGRLGRDAEAPQGNGPTRFSIAVNRRAKKGDEWTDEASWIDCEYWHKSILPYLVKGARIAIKGELRQERWTDKNSGQERSKLVVVAEDIQLLDSHKEGQERTQIDSGAAGPGYKPARAEATSGSSNAAPPDSLFNDDIPF